MTAESHPPETAPALPDWLAPALPFSRFNARVNGYAMHYVDQGEGPVVLMQHGNPTWCFLWRKVIERLAGKGVRVIAPDLVGLGLSDRPRHAAEHTLDFHANQLTSLVELLDLNDITLVAQDWGGPITAVMAARVPHRIHGAVFANTSIRPPTGRIRVTPFHRFANMPVVSDIAFKGFNFPVPVMHRVQGEASSIGKFERAAYAWPLRRWRDRATALALARMVPTSLAHPTVTTLQEVKAWVAGMTGPVELVWGKRDPILGGALKGMRKLFPDAPVTETDAGHFLQEEVPDELARAILGVALAKS